MKKGNFGIGYIIVAVVALIAVFLAFGQGTLWSITQWGQLPQCFMKSSNECEYYDVVIYVGNTNLEQTWDIVTSTDGDDPPPSASGVCTISGTFKYNCLGGDGMVTDSVSGTYNHFTKQCQITRDDVESQLSYDHYNGNCDVTFPSIRIISFGPGSEPPPASQCVTDSDCYCINMQGVLCQCISGQCIATPIQQEDPYSWLFIPTIILIIGIIILVVWMVK